MANLRLKFVDRYRDRHGKLRHYFRRPGCKRVALPGLPGSAEFMEAYQAALAGDTAPRLEIGESCSRPGSVSAVVALYLGSKDFGSLADATRRDRRRDLERFREAHGEKSFAGLEPRHVQQILAGRPPYAAKNFLKALRGLVAVAIRVGYRETDPTAGMRVKARASPQGFRAWTEDDIAQFEAAYPIGSRARLAFGLLLYTGQRRGDVIRMGRQHVKDGFMRVVQQKTGIALEIPTHPTLVEILAAMPAAHMTFLTTVAGKPFSAQGFTVWFCAMVREAGSPLGLSAHGLRKSMCRRLAEAGCSANQIAAIGGHATIQEVSRYTRAADQKRMAIAAMETIQRTEFPNHAEGLGKSKRK